MHKDIENVQHVVSNDSHVLHSHGAILRSVALLERHLQNYPDTFIAVIHDRWFLDRIATHMLAFAEEGFDAVRR